MVNYFKQENTKSIVWRMQTFKSNRLEAYAVLCSEFYILPASFSKPVLHKHINNFYNKEEIDM